MADAEKKYMEDLNRHILQHGSPEAAAAMQEFDEYIRLGAMKYRLSPFDVLAVLVVTLEKVKMGREKDLMEKQVAYWKGIGERAFEQK